MPKYSAKRIRLPGILPGVVVGIAIGLLLTGSSISRGGRPPDATPAWPPDIAHLSIAELARLPKSAL